MVVARGEGRARERAEEAVPVPVVTGVAVDGVRPARTHLRLLGLDGGADDRAGVEGLAGPGPRAESAVLEFSRLEVLEQHVGHVLAGALLGESDLKTTRRLAGGEPAVLGRPCQGVEGDDVRGARGLVAEGRGDGSRGARPEPALQRADLVRDCAIRPVGLEAHLPGRGGDREAGEGVVVDGADRVELVIVAAGAGHAEAEHRLGEDLHLMGHAVGLVAARGHGGVDLLAEEPGAGPEGRLVEAALGIEARLLDEVAREELGHETVVGDVGVEGAHDVVAVLPGVQDRVVELVRLRLRVAHEVEPAPRPPFTEVGGGEQAIDDALLRAGCAVREESVDLLGRGREAGQVEGHAAEPGERRRRPGGLDALLLQARVQQRVDGVLPVLHLHRRSHRREEAPAETIGVVERDLRRKVSAGGDPALEGRDVLVRDLAGRRHRQERIVVADGLDEQARVGVARLEERLAVDAGAEGLDGVEAQARLRIVAAVAADAVLREHRADLGFELARDLVSAGIVPLGQRGDESEGDERGAEHAGPILRSHSRSPSGAGRSNTRRTQSERRIGSQCPAQGSSSPSAARAADRPAARPSVIPCPPKLAHHESPWTRGSRPSTGLSSGVRSR